ncbi:MAG: FKBP-type peptidyl-prolyl cis-trans isomerase [Magnetospiraceae bacterium]
MGEKVAFAAFAPYLSQTQTWEIFMRHFRPVLVLVALFVALTGPTRAAEPALKITDIIVGTGAEVVPDSQVTVHYTGWLMDGTKFDSSLDRGQMFTITVGAGQVIPGWEQGLLGMKAGGKRELIIPPEMAYGPRGAGGIIPPNATLKFEIQLIRVQSPAYENIENGRLKDLLEDGIPVVDIRTPEEWSDTGVIEGSNLIMAFNQNRKFVRDFPDQLAEIAGKDAPVILICRTGSRTQAISRLLTENLGYTKVYNVRDGITHWIDEGNPVVKPES